MKVFVFVQPVWIVGYRLDLHHTLQTSVLYTMASVEWIVVFSKLHCGLDSSVDCRVNST